MNNAHGQDLDSRSTMLFQPDELAAHQYQRTLERVRPLQPEKRLMLAVLEDAIMCFQRYVHARGPKEQKLYENAASWIFARSDIRAFSFENICAVCGLDPDYLRTGLLNWRKQMNSVKTRPNRVPQVPRNAMRQWGMRGHKR
jgi:hypothetical protein